MTPLRAATADVEAAIAAATARCIRTAHVFDPDTPFALLGLDSLGTIEMASILEERLGCELPPELLLDCQDGRALAARIAVLRSTARSKRREDPFEQMFADAVLPAAIFPRIACRKSTDLRRARRILLTGATGFLGAALLKELRATTSAEVLRLVRRAAGHDPHQVVGDLSHPRLGLSASGFEALAASIDAIVHCGAAVNWIYPYSALRAANVLGTSELLRLACRGGASFHFISSLSVCYSTEGPRVADEGFDALPQLRGVRLGYAQTKVVAETLVREAGRRGLPVRIYRPALISGESNGGAYNPGDLVTTLIRGCVHMGTAPDLDWKLDALPVDCVAKAVVELSGLQGPVFHLDHDRPRHWRECVLWMRMYGYPLTLVPYHAWLRQLDRETSGVHAAVHPLRTLRTFFLHRHEDAGGLTLPELYEEGRRTKAGAIRTHACLRDRGVAVPALDARLLETYFAAFQAAGDLPAPARPRIPAPAARIPNSFSVQRSTFSIAFLSDLLRRPVADVHMIGSGSDHSIVSELTAWRSRRPSGLFHLDVRLADGSSLDVRLKVKAEDLDVVAVGESLAQLVDPAIGQAYAGRGHRLGFGASHQREIGIYRQTDRRFTRHAPALFGSISDDQTATWAMALENVTGASHIDTAHDPHAWGVNDIAAAVDGLASLQAIWYGRDTELASQPWIGYVQTAAGMASMSDLWTAMANHASPAFSSWAHPTIGPLHRRLVDSISRWWPLMEDAPRTLIHHDFNPRNICLRGGRLCAYDWELATIGAPQRDLAELLCFVLPPESTAHDVQHWIERHRAALERETGCAIEAEAWQQGFRGGLYDLLVNRLATYAVVHRIRRQPFLPRVVQTWHRLYQHFPLESCQ